MKIRNVILTVCVAFGLLIGGNAFAADLDGATILRLGVNPGVASPTTSSNIIFVTHPSFTGTLQAVMSNGLGDAGLATALTAMSLGQTVWLRVGSTDVTKVTTATIMYLNK